MTNTASPTPFTLTDALATEDDVTNTMADAEPAYVRYAVLCMVAGGRVGVCTATPLDASGPLSAWVARRMLDDAALAALIAAWAESRAVHGSSSVSRERYKTLSLDITAPPWHPVTATVAGERAEGYGLAFDDRRIVAVGFRDGAVSVQGEAGLFPAVPVFVPWLRNGGTVE